MSVALTEFMKSHPYFSALSRKQMESVASRIHEKRYDKDELVIKEGDPCRAMYFIKSGVVRILKTSPEGKERVLRMMGAGGSFNEVPVFDGGRNPASVKTLVTTTLCILSKKDLLSLASEYPGLSLAVLNNMASNLRHLVTLVEDLSFLQVTSRVAKTLLQYSHQEGAMLEQLSAEKRRLTQKQIASIVGTAREVVARSLKALENERAIRICKGRIEILDPKLLARKT